MVKNATQAFLAVSGHKYPDREHAPGKKGTLNKELFNNIQINKI